MLLLILMQLIILIITLIFRQKINNFIAVGSIQKQKCEEHIYIYFSLIAISV